MVDAYNETWTRKKTLPYSEFVNGSEDFHLLPVRRFGHSMASGSSINFSVYAENQVRSEIIDRIVMFGGAGLYE